MFSGGTILVGIEAWHNTSMRMREDYRISMMGLRAVILKEERPFADQNAMADVEGRPRPIRNFGINRAPNNWWSGYAVVKANIG